MKKIAHSIALSALLLASATTSAAEFNQVQPAKSGVTFAYKQMGVGMNGRFQKFDARVVFDPTRPTAATAQISIELPSIDAGSAEANDAVLDKDWFNAKLYPKATFVSSAVRALGGNRYEALGKLSIKGRNRDIAAPFTFSQTGGAGVFDGMFTLKRLDYAIGEGAWADVGTVANEIQIKFHVVAGTLPAKK
jgi:polyisoprenoid-binding protein YceI